MPARPSSATTSSKTATWSSCTGSAPNISRTNRFTRVEARDGMQLLYGLEVATGVAAELFAMRGYSRDWSKIAAVNGAMVWDLSRLLRPDGDDTKADMVGPPLGFEPQPEGRPAGPALVRPAPAP